jgi:hypothetical protein
MFDSINRVLYKTKGYDTSNINEDKEFQPFLIQRWCSMHSTPIAHIINETTNRYWNTLENNKDWFIALDTIIPTCKFKRISYIKKTKKEIVKKSNETLQKIANNLEISSREVNQYIEQFNLKIPNEEKSTT